MDTPTTINIGKTSEDVRSKRKKLAHSNFFITINTNKSFQTQDEAQPMTSKLEQVLDKVLAKVADYIIIEEPGKESIEPGMIKAINIDGVAEIGPRSFQPHAHVMIAISHYTKLKLDYKQLKEDVKTEMGIEEDIYFFSKLYRDAKANFLDYMKKTQSIE